MSKYLYRFLISIMVMGLGGLTHAALGQDYPCNPYAAFDGAVDPLILERDDFSAPVDANGNEVPQQIAAPTVPGTCLMIVGAIREGRLTDAGVPNPLQANDIYQLLLVPIAPTTFILTLKYNEGNAFELVVADAYTNLPIRDCPIEPPSFSSIECAVRINSDVNLIITGNYAGVYTLSITHQGL